jgi:hypothetical protein
VVVELVELAVAKQALGLQAEQLEVTPHLALL